ncbi:MAG: hypothetical protein ACREYE_12055 [Gammaproteobacteria bacterium]
MVAEIRILSNGSAGPNKEAAELEGLPTAGQSAEVAALATRAIKAEKPEDRLMALRGFLDRADPAEYNAALVPALKDEDPKIRQLALDSIGDGVLDVIKTPLLAARIAHRAAPQDFAAPQGQIEYCSTPRPRIGTFNVVTQRVMFRRMGRGIGRSARGGGKRSFRPVAVGGRRGEHPVAGREPADAGQ